MYIYIYICIYVPGVRARPPPPPACISPPSPVGWGGVGWADGRGVMRRSEGEGGIKRCQSFEPGKLPLMVMPPFPLWDMGWRCAWDQACIYARMPCMHM